MLFLFCRRIAGDPGGEIYTARTFSSRRYESKFLNSYVHPVPVVGGGLQPVGEEFAGKVVSKEFSDGCDKLVLDLTGCYQVKSLVKLTRTFVFDRERRTFTTTDEVVFSEPTAFESPIVTYAAVSQNAEKSLVLDAGEGVKAAVDVAVDGSDWKWRSEVMENPGRQSADRWAAVLKDLVLSAKVSIVFRF